MSVHKYYPKDLDLPGFQPAVLRFEVVLAVFFSATAVILCGVYFGTGERPCKNLYIQITLSLALGMWVQRIVVNVFPIQIPRLWGLHRN
jgi:hypothetical protein